MTDETPKTAIIENNNFPGEKKNAYICPHCNTMAQQLWVYLNSEETNVGISFREGDFDMYQGENCAISTCVNCKKNLIWVNGEIDMPIKHIDEEMCPPANFDMPNDVKDIYNQARIVGEDSPVSAVILLRKALELLLKNHLVTEGKNLADRIDFLINSGVLPSNILVGMDMLRVTGNDAVHEEIIDFDDGETAGVLFYLFNIIIDRTITETKKIEKMHGKLPKGKFINRKLKDYKPNS